MKQLSQNPTQREVDAAQRLGVGVELYRLFKRNAGKDGEKFELGDGPSDIVEEEHLHKRLRSQPGLFKPRNAPNLFVAASRTPGEVARTLLTCFCYLTMMLLIVGVGGKRVQEVKNGILQCIALGLLIIPAMLLSSFVWERIGEGARNVARALVRFWPLTLVAMIFALGLLRMLLA